MKISRLTKTMLVFTTFAFSHCASADSKHRYVSADVGIFQGSFDSIYNDTNSTIPANIRQPIYQNGYAGGLALGYSEKFRENYLLGVEASIHIAIDNAYLSTSSFTDTIKIQDYADLVFVPGIYITDTVAAYLKAGLSCAQTKDSLNSPTGFAPTYNSTTSDNFIWGAALGIGMKKFITPEVVVFTEYQYHDYRSLNLPGFQNFTTTYSHSANVYSQALLLGMSYFL